MAPLAGPLPAGPELSNGRARAAAIRCYAITSAYTRPPTRRLSCPGNLAGRRVMRGVRWLLCAHGTLTIGPRVMQRIKRVKVSV